MAIDTEERTKKPNNNSDDLDSKKNNNKKVITIVLVVVGVLIVLSIVGILLTGFIFKKGAETLVNQMSDGQVELNTSRNGTEINYKDDDYGGNARIGSGVELHSDFPKSDVPIYKGSTVVGSTAGTVDKVRTYVVTLTTKDSASKATKFYKDAFSGEGWKESFSMEDATSGNMAHYTNESKGMKVVVSVQREDDDDETLIMLTVNVDVK